MKTFTLPQLPYAYDALEPFIDKETMTIHHQRHHQAYVDNLNTALKTAEEASDDLDSILQRVSEYSPAVRNNGGGHYNHSLFWEILSAKPKLNPEGKLAEAINTTFGSLEESKAEMKKAGLGQFGSGWVWLFVKFSGSLAIASTPNQDNPMMDIQSVNRGFPILGIDVWEHAYYLAYQNKRADYLDAFWSVLDWSVVEKKYEEALSKIR
ncbi:superoxide dismutase [Chryseobacterium sp. W4I1]|uniref:superoxide dismutase n=1 Tax=Chryseobacterium sp. W4I1 TaxID=3042293 RepID=UPI002780CA25|nr:superoxide dismutase [Chryseobacterium sp. W4I1]MDQ0781229.1 Fe-Mn family superoxide dismutase [Chryseobacterium sp. W4I1]